jgi:uncharacterized phage-like protein YoqJ
MIVGVTGHRPQKLGTGLEPLRAPIIAELKYTLVNRCASEGITGMALGVDQYFAAACIALNIPFVAAIPFAGHESRWPVQTQQYYRDLLAEAHEVVYVSEPGFARWKFDARNRWLVDRCEILVAVWHGGPGGTADAVLYANSVQRPVEIINPRELIDA